MDLIRAYACGLLPDYNISDSDVGVSFWTTKSKNVMTQHIQVEFTDSVRSSDVLDLYFKICRDTRRNYTCCMSARGLCSNLLAYYEQQEQQRE